VLCRVIQRQLMASRFVPNTISLFYALVWFGLVW
jgi:hypothetical protein